MTTIDYSKFAKATPPPWEADWDESDGFSISMGTNLADPGMYKPQHRIEWDAGLFPEDGKAYEEASANWSLMRAAPTLLARCKALEEALRQSEKFIRDYLRDSGGCDHDVGICECETKRLLDSVVAALAANQ